MFALYELAKKIKLAFSSLSRELLLHLPDEFSKYRVRYYNRCGCRIADNVSISPNVRLRGKVEIGVGSSIAQNVSISGGSVGVRIGKDVMVAPNVVIVAFDHGVELQGVPMSKLPCVEAAVTIGDDVWVGANVTIIKGVTIGEGCIIGANSLVKCDVPPYSVFAGVPARLVRTRA